MVTVSVALGTSGSLSLSIKLFFPIDSPANVKQLPAKNLYQNIVQQYNDLKGNYLAAWKLFQGMDQSVVIGLGH